jgi:hypothetical protein
MSANTQMIQERPKVARVSVERQVGLLAGSMVLTMDGYKAVETLSAGTRMITRNGVRVLSSIKVSEKMMRPIRIAQGTLGCSRPKQDMLVAPHQEVLVRDWRAEVLFGSEQAMVPVSRMVDGTHIKPTEKEALHTSYALCFDAEEVFYADGMEFVAAPQKEVTVGSEICIAA